MLVGKEKMLFSEGSNLERRTHVQKPPPKMLDHSGFKGKPFEEEIRVFLVFHFVQIFSDWFVVR